MNAALAFTQQQVAKAMSSLGYQGLYDPEFARLHGIQEWGLRTRLVVADEMVSFTLRVAKGQWELDRDSYTVPLDLNFPNGRKSNSHTHTQVKHNVLELFDSQITATMLAGAYVAVLQAEFVLIRQRLMQLQTQPQLENCTSES